MKIALSYLFFFLFISVFYACKTSSKTNNGNSVNNEAHNSRNALDWVGVYIGVLPCADCDGIQTTMVLNANKTYVLETKYLGKSTQINKQTGTFSWNKAGNTIVLNNADKQAVPGMYFVGENNLTRLDMEGNRITGTLANNYVLAKEISGIVNKYWKLIELNGKPIAKVNDGEREPHIILKSWENNLMGHGGCNSLFGSYKLESGNRIRFSNMGSTLMACNNLAAEKQLFKALETADNYVVVNDTLWLNKARMAPIARFEAVYLY